MTSTKDSAVSLCSKSGEKRATPGQLVEPPAPPPPADPNTKSLEDYLKDFETWRARIDQASEWLEKLSGGDAEKPEPKTEEQKQQWLPLQRHHLHGFLRL